MMKKDTEIARQLVTRLAASVASACESALVICLTRNGTWPKHEGNPVLGGQYGTCFDICALLENG
jgi:hypothetical protein